MAWTIKVGERVYGPYTAERMRALADDGRLAANSLIARQGTTDWREARLETEFVTWFAQPGGPSPAAPGAVAPSHVAPNQVAPSRPETAPANIGGLGTQSEPREKTQFVIVIEVRSGTSGDLESMVSSLGPSFRLFPNMWIVSTHQSVAGIRNFLVPQLGERDQLFIVDATRGKASWINFAPETAAHIRKIWERAS